jgi:hypothetical protein
MEIAISRFVRSEKSSEPSNIVTEAAKGQIRGTGDDRIPQKLTSNVVRLEKGWVSITRISRPELSLGRTWQQASPVAAAVR